MNRAFDIKPYLERMNEIIKSAEGNIYIDKNEFLKLIEKLGGLENIHFNLLENKNNFIIFIYEINLCYETLKSELVRDEKIMVVNNLSKFFREVVNDTYEYYKDTGYLFYYLKLIDNVKNSIDENNYGDVINLFNEVFNTSFEEEKINGIMARLYHRSYNRETTNLIERDISMLKENIKNFKNIGKENLEEIINVLEKYLELLIEKINEKREIKNLKSTKELGRKPFKYNKT